MKKSFFTVIILLTFSFAFAEKKWAVWFYENGYSPIDGIVSLYIADSISLENGFVKLEGDIKYCKVKKPSDVAMVLSKSQEFGAKANSIGKGMLFLNSDKIFAIKEFEE